MPYALRKAAADLMYTLYLLSLVALSAGAWWPSSGSSSRPGRCPLDNKNAPDLRQLRPVYNTHHIFNAIHSSARQWGESLNHNGMSFFLATVPRGTLLHHGTHRPERVMGMEWLAFEPEHALNFAWKPCDNENIDIGIDAAIVKSHARSLNGWHQFLASFDSQNGELDEDAAAANADPGRLVMQDDAPEQSSSPPPPRHGPPFRCIEPGFLHTYSARQSLHLLYIDGQSAAKSDKGTLDSQDYVLRYNLSSKKPPVDRPMFGDWDRATELCYMAQHDYDGRVDGFIRMEHGFEVVLCDFSSLDVVSILQAQPTTVIGHADPDDQSLQEQTFMFMTVVGARYEGVGGDRVRLNYDHFVTSFAYPETDLWAQGGDLPRLNGSSTETLARIKDDVKHQSSEEERLAEMRDKSLKEDEKKPWWMQPIDRGYAKWRRSLSTSGRTAPAAPKEVRLTEMRDSRPKQEEKKPWWRRKIDRDHAKWRRPSSTPHGTPPTAPTLPDHHRQRNHPRPPPNWQTITDYYTTRYARYLPYLISGKFNTTTKLREAITSIYRPYMNYMHHDRDDEIQRCTTAYIPHHLLSIPAHQQCLAHRTTLSVASDVCEVLWDAMNPSSESDDTTYHHRITAIQSLMKRLAWTDWKKCSQPACALDEVCFTAIWPFGSQQDHDRPTCKNATSLMDEDSSMGYWYNSRRRRSSGGKKPSE
ncbi:hypothetical protein DV736_g3409, partial [Chaetothyriales sp. CBS 134916]